MPQTPHETVLRHELEIVVSRLARFAAGGLAARSEPSSLVRPFGSWEVCKSSTLDEVTQRGVSYRGGFTRTNPLLPRSAFRILDRAE
jgi:hypothetical protein